jgi:hypothetical protein
MMRDEIKKSAEADFLNCGGPQKEGKEKTLFCIKRAKGRRKTLATLCL